jgi:hypothetical protein
MNKWAILFQTNIKSTSFSFYFLMNKWAILFQTNIKSTNINGPPYTQKQHHAQEQNKTLWVVATNTKQINNTPVSNQ